MTVAIVDANIVCFPGTTVKSTEVDHIETLSKLWRLRDFLAFSDPLASPQ
jgi:hypothetical protein